MPQLYIFFKNTGNGAVNKKCKECSEVICVLLKEGLDFLTTVPQTLKGTMTCKHLGDSVLTANASVCWFHGQFEED